MTWTGQKISQPIKENKEENPELNTLINGFEDLRDKLDEKSLNLVKKLEKKTLDIKLDKEIS